MVNRWNSTQAFTQLDLSKTEFWILAHNIPICFITEGMVETIGQAVGKFLWADISENNKQRKAVRIRVEVDITKPLVDQVIVQIPGKRSITLVIKFERLGEFCYCCGKIGHKRDDCLPEESLTFSPPSQLIDVFGPCVKVEYDLENPRKSPRNPVTIELISGIPKDLQEPLNFLASSEELEAELEYIGGGNS